MSSMMPQAADTISMSYVDTIMNSMGCLLMIFLLLTVIRGNMSLVDMPSSDDAKSQTRTPNAIEGGPEKVSTRDPFVILVTASHGGTAIFGEDREGIWQLPNDIRDAQTSTGPSFAILRSSTSPSGKIELKKLRAGSSITYRVLQRGQKPTANTIDADANGSAILWAPQAEANP